MSALKKLPIPLRQQLLTLKLTPISLRELSVAHYVPYDIYVFEDNHFVVYLPGRFNFGKEIFQDILVKGHRNFYIEIDNYQDIKSVIQAKLVSVTRGLSIGNLLENCKRQINLLSLNFQYLYSNPTDDEALTLQYQSITNLSHFLIENPQMHNAIFNEILGHKYHYTISQPLLSSILLLGFLKHTLLFSTKEITSLFITSYFKDIGMSVIPERVLNATQLGAVEKNMIEGHSHSSVQILSGRIPLSLTNTKIIEHHHTHSFLAMGSAGQNDNLSSGPMDGIDQALVQGLRERLDQFTGGQRAGHSAVLQGIDSILVNVMDIIAAMITPRPYRSEIGLFEALEHVRKFIGDEYPKEFKLLVNYFHQFFSK